MTDREQALEEIDVFCKHMLTRATEQSELQEERFKELLKNSPDNQVSHHAEYLDVQSKIWKAVGSMESAVTLRRKILSMLNESDKW